MVAKHSNNASSTLAGSINSSVTSLAVASGDAAKFPSLSAGQWFPLTVVDSSGNMEIMKVTARSGATLTVVRGQEGTTAKSFAAGSKCDLRATAGSLIAMHAVSDIEGLDAALLLKADADAVSTALSGKSNTGHTHAIADVTGLSAALVAAAPSGLVGAFAMASAPTGWLKANGAAVSRTTYAALFAAIGTTFGAGDGSTTFNVPDLRGEFVRGLDDGRGVDASRVLGSAQSSQNLSHTHTGTADSAGAHTHTIGTSSANGGAVSITQTGSAVANNALQTNSGGAHTHNLTIASQGGSEARPRNVALLICIKF